jgi:hypothetical protein
MPQVETVETPAARPENLSRPSGARSRVSLAVYVLLLSLVSMHLYRTPTYSMDSLQYMGNALLMEERDPVRIHQRVYDELRRSVPKIPLDQLLGQQAGTSDDQNESRRMRAHDPYRFAEFLPLFAIRPLYNQTLYLVGKTGVGLVKAGVLISVASYFGIGILLFFWLTPYCGSLLGVAAPLLLMISPPLTLLGRDTTSDALASLVACAALYLIFERLQLAAGMTLLVASIYFRTDFVVLAGPVILACWLERRLDLWKGAVLSLLAVGSVLCINHFGGDYGIRMLYYRNFIGVPTAPGEMIVHFSVRDYLSAFRSGITLVEDSYFLPFLLLGTLGLRPLRNRSLFAVTLAYVLLHFVILPNWQERWVAVFYVAMLVCAVSAQGSKNVQNEATAKPA